MATKGFIAKSSGMALRAADKMSFAAPLATRLVIGLAFVHTGWGKWQHFDHTVQFFTSVGIPFPGANAALVASLELVGGAMLMGGVLTRFFAAGLSTTMVVALLTADRADFLTSWSSASSSSPTDVTSFVFLLFLLWLVLLGPGAVSVDHFLRRAILGNKKG
jgi:putative oxidoreductase